MTVEQKNRAIEIISKSNSVNVRFNVPIKIGYSRVYEILIIESNASLISELTSEGYSVSMTKKGLSVNKYS